MFASKVILLFGLVLGLIGIASCADCHPSWLENQASHQIDVSLLDKFPELDEISQLSDVFSMQEILEVITIPRVVDSEGIAFVKDFISSFLTDLGWFVELDNFSQETVLGPHSFTNIIARTHPDRPRQIVLACHYDTLITLEGFVGAIDAAVPCAQILDLARALTPYIHSQDSNPKIPDLGLTLIFFDGEEALKTFTPTDSLYGSRHLSELWSSESYQADPNFCQTETNVTQMSRIDLFVLLDLIGASAPKIPLFSFDGSKTNQFYNHTQDAERRLAEFFPTEIETIFHGELSRKMVKRSSFTQQQDKPT